MNLKKLATSFSRGLNQAASHTLNDGECQVSENFIFKDRSATVRKGYTVHAQVTSAPIVALEKFYQADGDAFFTAIGNGVLHYSVTSGVFNSLSTEPISGPVSKAVYDGAMYFTDFSTPVKFFNGATIGVAGLSSPVFIKQLDDCEDYTRWVAQDVNGGVTQDSNYMHRDKGQKAITVYASNPATAHVSQYGGANNALDVVVETNNPNSTNYWSKKKAMCMDTSGNIHVISNQGSGSTSSLMHYMSQNYGSTWSVTQACSGIANQVGGQVHPNYSGGVSLIYSTSTTIKHSRWTYQSGWIDVDSSGVIFSSYAGNIPKFSTDIDQSGNIHTIALTGQNTYFSGTVYYAKYECSSDFWSATSSVNSSGVSWPGPGSVDICVNRSNVPYLSWAAATQTFPNFTHKIGFLHGLSGIADISSVYSDRSGTGIGTGDIDTNILVDNSSAIHVVYYTYRSSAGGTLVPRYNNRVLYNGSSAWSQEFSPMPSSEIGVIRQQGYGVPLVNYSTLQLNFIWPGYSNDSPSIITLRHATFTSGSWSTATNYDKHPNAGETFSVIDGVWTSSNNRMRKGWSILWWGSGHTMNYKASPQAEYFNSPQATPVFDLTKFAPDVTSHSGYDCVQLYTVLNKKENISSFLLKFVDAAGYQAIANITSTSAWASCSNHEWGMTITYPKSNMSTTNAAFAWNACDMQVALTPVSGQGLAKVAVDNIILINSPAIISSRTSAPANISQLFWGSSSAAKRIRVQTGTKVIKVANGGVRPAFSDTVGTFRERRVPTFGFKNVIRFNRMQLEGFKKISDPLPNGTYYYKTTFVKESPSGFEIESNPTFASSGVIVSSNTSSWTYLNLVAVPVAPDNLGAVARRVYRRRSDEPEYRFVYTIHDNTETTFTDTVPEATLGWSLEEDHNPPPAAKFMLKGSDQRMYYFNTAEEAQNYPSRVRISKPYEPYYVPHEDTIDISPDDGTEGTGMFEYQGIVHFLKERSTWSVENGLTNKNPSIGCVAPDSVAVGRNEVFWMSDQGPIMYNGRFYNIGHSRDTASLYRIQTILDRLPKDYLKNAKGVYYDGLYLLAVTDQGSTINNLVLCYDVDNDAWTTFPGINVTCWSIWNGYKDGYRLFFGNTSGQVCEMFSGDYDISAPISYRIQSKDFGVPSPTEFYRKGFVFTQNLDNTVKTITGQPYYDFTQTSSHAHDVEISGTYNTTKFQFPDTDDASFFSFGLNGSGRIRINVAEIYRKDENLR